MLSLITFSVQNQTISAQIYLADIIYPFRQSFVYLVDSQTLDRMVYSILIIIPSLHCSLSSDCAKAGSSIPALDPDPGPCRERSEN